MGRRARTQAVVLRRLVPVELGRAEAGALDHLTTRCGASSRKTPTVRISGGRRLTMSPAVCAVIWRTDGAKMKPTASAPKLTHSSASASEVMPQILTKRSSFTGARHRAAIG